MKILYLYPFSFQKKKNIQLLRPKLFKVYLRIAFVTSSGKLGDDKICFCHFEQQSNLPEIYKHMCQQCRKGIFLRTIKFPGSSLTLVQGDISFRRSLYLLKLSNFQKKQLHDCTQASCFFFNLGMQCRTDNSYNEHQTLLSEISISFFTCFKRTTILNNY